MVYLLGKRVLLHRCEVYFSYDRIAAAVAASVPTFLLCIGWSLGQMIECSKQSYHIGFILKPSKRIIHAVLRWLLSKLL